MLAQHKPLYNLNDSWYNKPLVGYHYKRTFKMSLLEAIKQDLTTARFAKNQAVLTILSTLLGESAAIGKTKRNADSTDEEVASVVRKFIINLDETLKHYEFLDADSEMSKKLRFEREIIIKYMPVQMSEDELKFAISTIINEKGINQIGQVGLVMGELKKRHNGKYDGAIAIQIAKESLV